MFNLLEFLAEAFRCTWHRKASAKNSSKLNKFLHSEVNQLITTYVFYTISTLLIIVKQEYFYVLQTTLAHIIAQLCKRDNQDVRFVKLSATMSGVNDIKEAVKIAKNELASFKRKTILFMDEIHRFNKLQQVIF